jgi:membrane fusion protein, multidrug efflux system
MRSIIRADDAIFCIIPSEMLNFLRAMFGRAPDRGIRMTVTRLFHLSRNAALFLLLGMVASCSKGTPEGAGNPMANMPPPEVTTTEIQPATVPVSYEYVGQTVGSREVEIRARVTGHVEKRLYREGDLVKAGQPLFQLDARPFVLAVNTAQTAVTAAEADIARAEASAAQSDREQKRMSNLADASAVSRKEADDAGSSAQITGAEVRVAKARLDQARAQLKEAQLNLEYASIAAPISGIIGRALQQEGSLVSPSGDSLLTTLVQLDPLYVTFNVAGDERGRMERELADGRLTLPREGFKVRLLRQDGSELGRSGRINFVSSSASHETGTLEMRAELDNPGNIIKSGLFVRVLLEGAERPNTLTVPQRAVLEGPKGKMVMVAVKDKTGKLVAEPRPVEVGEWVAGSAGEKSWVVRSGLQPGDQVIVEGLMKLRPGSPVSIAGPSAARPASAAAR